MQKTERLYTAWGCSRSDEAEETGKPRSRSADNVSGLLYGRAQNIFEHKKKNFIHNRKKTKMIQHWLVNKKVHWNTLERGDTKSVSWYRQSHRGRVLDVDSTGTVAAVQEEQGNVVLVEVCELTKTKKSFINKT